MSFVRNKGLYFVISTLAIAVVFGTWYIKYEQNTLIFLLCLLCLGINYFYVFFPNAFHKCFDFLIRYRYVALLLVFIVCVFFQVSGSSIGSYNAYFPEDGMSVNEHILLGEARSIRSDEYVVQTPYYFSQSYNDFARTSNYMALAGQDMIIGYNSPVLDISILAKPLLWGYVFLGNDYGLSWYWCLKTILIFLVMFELIMILTKKNKYLSFLGALLLAFAPNIQWFFVPHLSDVFLWGMALVVLGYHFFTSQKKWLKILTVVLLPLTAIGFVLAMYPPLQVPIGLLAIVLLVSFLIRDKEKITFHKKDIWIVVLMALVAILIIGYELYQSLDAIELLYNTDYPGSRVILGGNYVIQDAFTNLVNMFLPYRELTYSNNCEASGFFHFGPICFLIFAMIYKKLKEQKDRDLIVGKFLTITLIVELFFMLIGFPYLLSKITLFSYINRMESVYGFTASIYTLYIVYMLFKHKELLTRKQKNLCIGLFFVSYLFMITEEQLSYLPFWIYILEILLFTVLLAFVLYQKKALSYIVALSIIVYAGILINPITIGTDDITEHAVVKEANALRNEEDGYFLTTDNIVVSSILLANGNKVINAVNYYPDFAKWELIDPEGNHRVYYNRYLHEIITIGDGETTFDLVSPDCISLKLNLLDILKLPVTYIMTLQDLSELSSYEDSGIQFVKQVGSYRFYKVGS